MKNKVYTTRTLPRVMALSYLLLLYISYGNNAYGQCRPHFYTGFLNYGFTYNVADSITRVTFNTLNNYTGNTAPVTDSIYSDYTGLSTRVCKGQSYMLNVWAGDTALYHTGVIAWIDFNNNGSFEASEMVLQDSVRWLNRNTPASASVLIPLTAVAAQVKMRVLAAYTMASVFPNRMPPNDACFNYAAICHDSFPSLYSIPYPDIDAGCMNCISCDALSGEFEEYTILITEPPQSQLSGSDTVCAGNGALLSFPLTGTQPWSLTWTDGTNPVTVTGITNSPYQHIFSPTASATYSLVSVSDLYCGSNLSGSRSIEVPVPVQAQIFGNASICQGDGVQLTFQLSGHAPWNLTYSDGTNPVSISGITQSPYLITLSPMASLTYFPVNISSPCGAGTVSGTFEVQVAPALQAQLGGGGDLCLGSGTSLSINLTGVSPWNFTWSDGSVQTQQNGITNSPYFISISPGVHSTYTLVSLSDQCGSGGILSGTAEVRVWSIPSVSFDNSVSYFCTTTTQSISGTLTGNAPWSVIYTDGTVQQTVTGITSQTFQFIETPTSSTTWTPVQVSDAHCINNSGSGFVAHIYDTGPSAIVTSSQTVCAGNSAIFRIAGHQGIQPWDFVFSDGTVHTTFTGITALPYIFQVTPSQNSTYQITQITHPCPAANISGTPTVTLTTPPIAIVSAPTEYCTGNSVMLSFQLSGNTPWVLNYLDGTNPESITGITTNIYEKEVYPTGSVTYTLQSVGDVYCTVDDGHMFTLQENIPANAFLSPGDAICEGTGLNLSVNLSGTIPYTLMWSDGAQITTQTGINSSPLILSLSPAQTTTYTITGVQNICGSGNISSPPTGSVITIYENPAVILTGSQTLCGADAAQLNLIFSQAPGPWNVVWTDGSVFIPINGITSNPHTFSVSPQQSTTYQIFGLDNGNCGGTFSGSAEVSVLPAPSVQWTDTFDICRSSGFSTVLALSGQAPWEIAYSDGVTQYILTGISSSVYTFSQTPMGNTTYTLQYLRDAVCQKFMNDEIQVQVYDKPTVLITAPASVCAGNAVSLSFILTGLPPWSLNWSNGSQVFSETGISTSPYLLQVTPQVQHSYSLIQVSDPFCMETQTQLIPMQILPLPLSVFDFQQISNTIFQFNNLSSGLGVSLWDFGDGNTTAQLNPQHNYTLPGSYNVSLQISNACGTHISDTLISVIQNLYSDGNAHPYFEIYPNPGIGIFVMKCSDHLESSGFWISDFQGRLIQEYKAWGGERTEINLQNHTPGIYFVHFQIRDLHYPTYKLVLMGY